MNRRKFNGSLLSLLLASRALAQASGSMDKHENRLLPGLQLYTVRAPLAEDMLETLTVIADMGYAEVEFAGHHGVSAGDIRTMLHECGLRAPAAHAPVESLRSNIDTVLRDAETLDHRYLVVPYLSPDQRTSIADYENLASTLQQAGAVCRDAGVSLLYHNHAFEFEEIDGVVPYDLLLDSSDETVVGFEIDLYWVAKAGRDPVEYFRRYPGRFPLWHVKDMDARGNMTDVGTGTLNFDEFFEYAQLAGLRHPFVERDDANNPLQSASISLQGLKKILSRH